MGSKSLLFLCLSLAVVFLTVPDAGARELTETSSMGNAKEAEFTEGLEEAKYPRGGGHPGRSYPGGGYPGGGYPGGGYPGRDGGGGYCRGGCCGRNYLTGRCKCCSYAEAVASDAKP